MVKASEIRDRDSLEQWLSGQSRSVAIAIAQRAACRVLPLFGASMGEDWARKNDVTALPVLRAILTSGTARRYGLSEVGTDDEIAADADLAGLKARAYDPGSYAAAASATAAAGIFAATDAANAAAFAARAVETAAIAADAAAHIWEQVREDARLIEAEEAPLAARLWSIPEPDWFRQTDAAMRAIWQAEVPERWAFWTRLWDGVLSGRQVDWELQRQVALIPDDVWQQGPDAVAEAIARLRRERSIEKTSNAECVELNPETGRLRLVPESDLPEDIAQYARRKISKALDLFGDEPTNQYTGLGPAFRVLKGALEEAGNLPVELFDACASASRLTVNLARQGDCPAPEQDALLQDFLTRVREAGADILANDPKTQEVLERRNAIMGNDALIEGREVIAAAAAEIAQVSEGLLATALPEDAEVASDPKADPEDRKVAGYRLSGRLLRAGKVIAWAAAGTGGAVVGTKEVLEALPAIAASPIYQQAVAYVFKWLGL